MSRLEMSPQDAYTKGDKKVRLVHINGIISAPTINRFREGLKKTADANLPVLLDFSEVSYINSTGLGKLVLFFDQLNENGSTGALVNLREETLRLVQMLGLQEVLTVCKSVQDGLNFIDIGDPTTNTQLLREASDLAVRGRFRISSAPPPRLPEAHILIGMNPEDPLAKLICRALTGDRGNVVISDRRDQILEALSEDSFDLAILDESLPYYQQICFHLKTGPNKGMVSIIKVGSNKNLSTAASNLSICADETIREPFDIQELFAIAISEYDRTQMESTLFIKEVQLAFSSSIAAVEEGLAMLEKLVHATGMTEIECSKFLQSLGEAVDNARKHGNMEDPFRGIKVQFLLDHEKLTVTVEDEGLGFDFKKRIEMAKNFTPLQQARNISFDDNKAGLGINIMLRCCDIVEYTAPGNCVRLSKYLGN